ncbi:unnamed protein product [Thelazia callipaeda]|uniref:DUF148 domain-containing protein n=1 Tax=Thelazia callipaeda TaxID=103827 RepID=A0A0N5CRI5_THECL|nr:unnamed protein product [Thelazia callipaeda]
MTHQKMSLRNQISGQEHGADLTTAPFGCQTFMESYKNECFHEAKYMDNMHGPPFITLLNPEDRKEFENIRSQDNITGYQIIDNLKQWAAKKNPQIQAQLEEAIGNTEESVTEALLIVENMESCCLVKQLLTQLIENDADLGLTMEERLNRKSVIIKDIPHNVFNQQMSALIRKEKYHQIQRVDPYGLINFRFRANVGRRIIEEVLTENLSGLTYESNDIEELSKSLALKIRCRLKELDLPRYKYIVQVILGEERGQGARYKASGGCIWDNDSDSVAYHTYSHQQELDHTAPGQTSVLRTCRPRRDSTGCNERRSFEARLLAN